MTIALTPKNLIKSIRCNSSINWIQFIRSETSKQKNRFYSFQYETELLIQLFFFSCVQRCHHENRKVLTFHVCDNNNNSEKKKLLSNYSCLMDGWHTLALYCVDGRVRITGKVYNSRTIRTETVVFNGRSEIIVCARAFSCMMVQH